MKELLLPAINLLPNVAIIVLLAYFYAQKKLTGLIWMLIAYIVLTLTAAASIYGIWYFQARAMSAVEMQKIYSYIGVISLLAQLLLVVGLVIVLNRYPDSKLPQKEPLSF